MHTQGPERRNIACGRLGPTRSKGGGDGGFRPLCRRILAVGAVLGAVASAGAGQEAAAGTAAEWQTRLRAIGERLLAEEWTLAEQDATALTVEMSEQIVGGVGTDLLLGVATTYRALALAGLDRGPEAVWHWQVAQQLFPEVAEIDLERFGMRAAALALHPPRRLSRGEAPPVELPDGEFVPPRRLSAPSPVFPSGRAFRGLQVDVVVQVVIDTNGRPTEPVIVNSKGELTLVWAALEALREWTFAPATRDGVPEASLYKLTVSFVVPTE